MFLWVNLQGHDEPLKITKIRSLKILNYFFLYFIYFLLIEVVYKTKKYIFRERLYIIRTYIGFYMFPL